MAHIAPKQILCGKLCGLCGKDGERIFKQIYQNTATNKGELNAQQKSELKNELETLLKCL